MELAEKPSRQVRVAALARAIQAAEQLVRDADAPQGGRRLNQAPYADRVGMWREDTLAVFTSMAIGEPWIAMLKTSNLAPLTGGQDILQLRMLQWRIHDEGPEELSDADMQLLRLSARFVVFGDFFVDQAAAEWRDGIRSDMWDTVETFKRDLHAGLSVAEPQSHEIAKSVAFIRRQVDATGNIVALAYSAQWHVAWTILTLGWQLAERLGFSTSVWPQARLCTWREAVASRVEFRACGAVTCPRCHSTADVPPEYNEKKGLVSVPWECNACAVMGYFPLQVGKDSLWFVTPPEPHSTAPKMTPTVPNLPAVAEEGPDSKPTTSAFDIAIVCAVHLELEKVLQTGKAPWTPLPVAGDPASYHETTYEAKSGPIRVVAAVAPQMGMPASAMLATKMILTFRPRLVGIVGIAAGVDSKKQGFGDVLAPDRTFDYASGKVKVVGEGIELEPDPDPLPIQANIAARLGEWKRERRELDAIARAWPATKPRTPLEMHVGPLGSGPSVIDARKPVVDVLAHWRKLIGIEMEAHGVHLACHKVAINEPAFLCMKSICDFAAEKADTWQPYAAYTAAQLFHRFVSAEWDTLFAR